MRDATDASPTVIGIECESLEGDSWGVARLTRKLLERLAARPGIERTHRFLLYSDGPLPDEPLFAHPAFVRRPLGLARLRSFSLYYYLLLPLELWRVRPAAVYYPNYMLPLAHPPHVPSAVMMTEDIFREADNPRLPLRYRLAYALFSCFWAARQATRVMAISASSADELARLGVSPARIETNPLGVDAPATGGGADAADVLYVGQAFPRRHLAETLDAFARLAADRPGLTMRAIGPDKYEPRVIGARVAAINAALGRPAVRWDERVGEETLAAAYRGARVAVYVSDAEAFGLPPLEALSYGVPAVVADAPVNREIYGSHAFYAGPTADDIAAALARALDDTAHREAIRAAAPAILSRYTWDAHAERWLGFMHRCV